MDIDRFWQLIDQARAAAGPQADLAVRDFDLREGEEPDPDHDYWDFDDEDMKAMVAAVQADLDPSGKLAAGHAESADLEDDDDEDEDDDDDEDDEDEDEDDLTDPVAIALTALLAQLPAAQIAGFDNTFEDVRALADHPTMANAALLIEHGLLGDDSFDDFRGGLVALGRSTFEAAVADPDSLADHPLVREIAAANDPRWLGREDMLWASSHAYTRVTGEAQVTFFEFAEELREVPPVSPDEDDDWDITDEAVARQRLPRLTEYFYERSMGNRRRALDKLGLRD